MREGNEPATILIVEDDQMLADWLQYLLVNRGYRTLFPAYSGKEAVERAIKEQPDLVLMDISLSDATDMDGIEAAQAIHEQTGVPIIFLTGYADLQTIERAKASGAYNYLLKPIDNPNRVVAAIEMALHKSKADKDFLEQERLIAKAFIEGQDQEKVRLEYEIREELGVRLSRLGYYCDTVSELRDEAALVLQTQEIRALMVDLQEKLRDICFQLVPNILSDFGLTPALQRLCARFEQRTGIQVPMDMEGLEERLAPALEMGAYWILVELLHLFERGAQITCIQIELTNFDETLTLVVSHDGKAEACLSSDNPHVRNVQARVKSLNGTLNIDTDGAGYFITLPITTITNNITNETH